MTYLRRLTPCLVAAAFCVLCAAAAPAARAHSAQGELALVSSVPSGLLQMDFEVRLSYADDGHVNNDATVTVLGQQSEGIAVMPIEMDAVGSGGLYKATVKFPEKGTWKVVFTSVDPSATLDETVSVTATDDVEETVGSPASPAAEAGGTGTDESRKVVYTTAAVVVGALVLIGIIYVAFTRKRDAESDGGAGDESGADGVSEEAGSKS